MYELSVEMVKDNGLVGMKSLTRQLNRHFTVGEVSTGLGKGGHNGRLDLSLRNS